MTTESVSKVAEVTLSFWLLKTIATTIGDISGDALSISMHLGYVVALIIALGVAVILLTIKLRAKQFRPLLYWILILSSSTAGAEMSDGIDRALHMGTVFGAGLLLTCLLAIFMTWLFRSGRVGFYPIRTRQDEVLYWLSAIFANGLGSSLGDLLGDKFGMGVLGCTIAYFSIIALLLVLHYITHTSKAVLFWTAFVFTRVPF